MLYWSWDFKNYTGEVASLKNNIMYMISLVNSELRILALFAVVKHLCEISCRASVAVVEKKKIPARRGNAAESMNLVSLEERERW